MNPNGVHPRYLIRMHRVDNRIYEIWRDQDGSIFMYWSEL